MITIDASVFLSAALSDEIDSACSEKFLAFVAQAEIPVICPTLLLPEIAAAIARRKSDSETAQEIAETLPAMFRLSLVVLDDDLARQSARIAAGHRLRGADAIYVAVAKKHGTVLITWDREQLDRAKTAVSTQSPDEYLAASKRS